MYEIKWYVLLEYVQIGRNCNLLGNYNKNECVNKTGNIPVTGMSCQVGLFN